MIVDLVSVFDNSNVYGANVSGLGSLFDNNSNVYGISIGSIVNRFKNNSNGYGVIASFFVNSRDGSNVYGVSGILNIKNKSKTLKETG